jgi:site-specific DNA-cytosine methylase
MLIAGTSCVDYSGLNTKQKGLEEGGESGLTFKGMLAWVKKYEPPIVILENVSGAPWTDQIQADRRKAGKKNGEGPSIEQYFREIGYTGSFVR